MKSAGETTRYAREDLYYRIGVINVKLPPLRERGDDIMLNLRPRKRFPLEGIPGATMRRSCETGV